MFGLCKSVCTLIMICAWCSQFHDVLLSHVSAYLKDPEGMKKKIAEGYASGEFINTELYFQRVQLICNISLTRVLIHLNLTSNHFMYIIIKALLQFLQIQWQVPHTPSNLPCHQLLLPVIHLLSQQQQQWHPHNKYHHNQQATESLTYQTMTVQPTTAKLASA